MHKIKDQLDSVPDSSAGWSLVIYAMRGRLRRLSQDAIAYFAAADGHHRDDAALHARQDEMLETAIALRAELDGLIKDLQSPPRFSQSEAA